jgi:hypothetical protein
MRRLTIIYDRIWSKIHVLFMADERTIETTVAHPEDKG